MNNQNQSSCSSCKFYYSSKAISHSLCVADGAPFKVVRSCKPSCPKFKSK